MSDEERNDSIGHTVTEYHNTGLELSALLGEMQRAASSLSSLAGMLDRLPHQEQPGIERMIADLPAKEKLASLVEQFARTYRRRHQLRGILKTAGLELKD